MREDNLGFHAYREVFIKTEHFIKLTPMVRLQTAPTGTSYGIT